MDYKIVVMTTAGEEAVIDWGNSPQWKKRYAKQLEAAKYITLSPKKGKKLPTVVVNLPEGSRWVLFSRVVGDLVAGVAIRMYVVGWQMTVRGVNVKALNWIYPNGTVECSEEPSFALQYLKRLTGRR